MLLQGIRSSFSIFGPQTVRMRTVTDLDLLRVWCSGRDQATRGRLVFRAWERRSQPLLPSPQPPSPLTGPGIDADRPADAAPRARTSCSSCSGCSGCGSAPALDLAASGAGLQSLPSAPARLRAPGPALSAAYRSCAPPGKLGSARAPPTRTSPGAREPRGRLAPPTAFAAPGLACAAASLSGECGLYQPPTGIRIISSAKKSLP